MIRLVIVEDLKVVSSALKALLESTGEIQVVAAFGTGEDFLSGLASTEFDVALMDRHLPGIDGVETSTRALKEKPLLKIVMLSVADSITAIRSALKVGIHSYVLKASELGDKTVIDAIKAAHAGEDYIPADVAAILVQSFRSPHVQGPLELTPRETEIVKLTAEGLTSLEMADRLNVSQNTVQTHRHKIRAKTGVRNSAELISWAYENGIL